METRNVVIEQMDDDTYTVSPPDYTIYDGDEICEELVDAEASAEEFAEAYKSRIEYRVPGMPAFVRWQEERYAAWQAEKK